MNTDTTTALITLSKTGLTISRVQELIIAHKAPMKSRAIVRLVQEFSLTETDVDLLLEARAEYSAAPARMHRLLESGFTALQVNSLYEARDRINNSVPDVGVTINKLLLIRDAFAGADCDADSLTEIVLAIFESVRKNKPEVSLGAAINTACTIAKSSGAVMLETVLDLMQRYGSYAHPQQEVI